LVLPTTDYILSRVFDMYVNKEYTFDNQVYTFIDTEKDLKYKMYIEHGEKFKILIIEKYKDNQLIQTYEYY